MNEEQKYLLRKVLFGIAGAFIVIALILGGAYVSCNAGGGTLSGTKCIGYEIINTCEEAEKLYVLPKTQNTTGIIYDWG
jgi:hypothetical protein